MKKLLKILRYNRSEKRSYWQSFDYETENEQETIATALKKLNLYENLTDTEGNKAQPIKWECSCLQKKCGSCAMLINNAPALVCDTKLNKDDRNVIELAPLEKFPVVEDLIVDRSVIFNNLKKLQVWFDENANTEEQDTEDVFEASRCLKCGCCLEICISFMPGEVFMGNTAMVAMARLIAELPRGQRNRTYKAYRKYIYDGCDKFNACHQICPAGIDTARLMAHSNAAMENQLKSLQGKNERTEEI
jgi:succinate dehydrogenase / fumarate reductase iron-sulfur subunit